MLVLDTDVISEIMKALPSARVMEWWSQHPSAELFTTTVNMAEIFYGIEILPGENVATACLPKRRLYSLRTLSIASCRSTKKPPESLQK